jgi:hypothetical protein
MKNFFYWLILFVTGFVLAGAANYAIRSLISIWRSVMTHTSTALSDQYGAQGAGRTNA